MLPTKLSLGKSLLVSISLSALLFTACDKDDDDDNNSKVEYTISATLNGAKERPAPVETAATGSVTGTYNKNTNVLNYHVTWTGLTGPATAMHFHGPATVDETAPPVVPVAGFPAEAGAMHQGTANLTEAQEADLLAGKWYFNIHTQAHQPGEIRGQVATN